MLLGLATALLASAFAEFVVLNDTYYNAKEKPSTLTAEATLCTQMCQATTCSVAVFDMNKVSKIIWLLIDWCHKALKFIG